MVFQSLVTRPRLTIITAAAAFLLVSVYGARGQEPTAVPLQKWDCVKNDTGKYLRLVLASELKTGTHPLVAPGEVVTFPVSSNPKVMAIVAFEYNKNNLVTLTRFFTVPQNYPPSNCYPITETSINVKELERKHELKSRSAGDVY